MDSSVVHICGGGPVYEIEFSGEIWQFEMNSYCGPSLLNKNGSIKQIPNNHEFWHIATLWAQQGRRVVDGKAVWDEPPDPTPYLVHIGGKHWTTTPDAPDNIDVAIEYWNRQKRKHF